jgi:hypothetical protein
VGGWGVGGLSGVITDGQERVVRVVGLGSGPRL